MLFRLQDMRGTGDYLNYFILASIIFILFFVGIITGLLIEGNPDHVQYIYEMLFCIVVAILSSSTVIYTQLKGIRKQKKERKSMLSTFAEQYGYIEEYVNLPNPKSVFQLPMFTEKGFKDVVGCIEMENEVCKISIFDYMFALKKNTYNLYFYSFFYIESKSINIPSFSLLPLPSKKIPLYEQECVQIKHNSFNKHFMVQAKEPYLIEKWFNSNIISFLLRDKGVYMQTTPKGLLVWRTYLQYDEEEFMEFILRYVYFFNLLLEGLQNVEGFIGKKQS